MFGYKISPSLYVFGYTKYSVHIWYAFFLDQTLSCDINIDHCMILPCNPGWLQQGHGVSQTSCFKNIHETLISVPMHSKISFWFFRFFLLFVYKEICPGVASMRSSLVLKITFNIGHSLFVWKCIHFIIVHVTHVTKAKGITILKFDPDLHDDLCQSQILSFQFIFVQAIHVTSALYYHTGLWSWPLLWPFNKVK